MTQFITKSKFKKIGDTETTITSIYELINGKEVHYKTIEHTEIKETAYNQTTIKGKYGYTDHWYDNYGMFNHYLNNVILDGKHEGQLDHPYNSTSIEYIISSSDYNKFHGKEYPEHVFNQMRLNYFRSPIDRIYNDYLRTKNV